MVERIVSEKRPNPEKAIVILGPCRNMASPDLGLNSVSGMSSIQMPMSLPWHPSSIIKIGALFHSDRASEENPWAKETLFEQSSLDSISAEYHSDEGAQASFRSSVSSRSGQHEDHLSIGMGVSIGCPILGVGASGQYDKHLVNNKSVCISFVSIVADAELCQAAKSSIRASYRSGIVSLTKTLPITEEAKRVIKYDGGIEALTERFGDYYVGGYALGGDTGALVSAASVDSQFYKRLKIILKIQILFITIRTTLVDELQRSQFSLQSESLSGYDSLSNTYVLATSRRGSRPEDVLSAAENLANLAQNLASRVDEKMVHTGLDKNGPLTLEDCERLFASGLVVELLLFPVALIRDVLVWRTNTNII